MKVAGHESHLMSKCSNVIAEDNHIHEFNTVPEKPACHVSSLG